MGEKQAMGERERERSKRRGAMEGRETLSEREKGAMGEIMG